MITFGKNGEPIFTCPCGSQWWVTGKNDCWECGRIATEEEIKEYEECIADIKEFSRA